MTPFGRQAWSSWDGIQLEPQVVGMREKEQESRERCHEVPVEAIKRCRVDLEARSLV